MRPAWRLATNSLSARRSRSLLLIAAVALSAALIVSVCCATATIHGAINHQLATTVGAADARVKPASGATLEAAVLGRVEAWREVKEAVGRLQGTLSVSVRLPAMQKQEDGTYVRKDALFASTALGNSLKPGGDSGRAGQRRTRDSMTELAPPPDLIQGRMPAADDEIVIDSLLAFRLSGLYAAEKEKRDGFILGPGSTAFLERPVLAAPAAVSSAAEAGAINASQRVRIGDTVDVVRQLVRQIDVPLPSFRPATKLKVVGIAAQPPLGGRPQCYLTLGALSRLSGETGLSQIDIAVRPGVNPGDLVAAHRGEMPKGLLLETTEKITSGLDKNIQSSQLGMVLATVMAFMSAAFIITTGLTTSVTERQRELAILRCIGGTRGQLARTQLLVGVILGALGAIVGVPLGIGVGFALAWVFRDQLPTGLVVPGYGVALGAVGSLVSGVAGAAWPAWRASKLSPLLALASRAAMPGRRGLIAITLIGLVLLGYQAAVVTVPRDGQVMFWLYATSALPAMFLGHFLLGVPVTLLVVWGCAGVVTRGLGLPRHLLGRAVAATPYRHGFTAGALMGGLALMIALWTNGGAMLRDWLDKIQFPDAFVSGLNLTEEHRKRLDAMTDVVGQTCAITLHPVETDVFGVRALQKYKTTFVGFDPDAFFKQASLAWVQGDPETALRRLKQGGAVIVAREFLTAQGLGVGHRFTCVQDGKTHEFEIVGVVASPGLEIVSKFFNVREDYTDQALHAVFGSREDMKQKFFDGKEAPIQLIQIQFAAGVGPGQDGAALEKIRRELFGAGILDVGSGREIKEQITVFARGTLLAVSAVALTAMLVASFGVANLVIAGIEARKFEFGVLRAVGGQRSLLTRLIIGEALLLALTAALLGTAMGIQGSWAGQKLHALLLGISLHLRPPVGPIAAGWVFTIVLAQLAAWPAVARLNRLRPRDLLGATRG